MWLRAASVVKLIYMQEMNDEGVWFNSSAQSRSVSHALLRERERVISKGECKLFSDWLNS